VKRRLAVLILSVDIRPNTHERHADLEVTVGRSVVQWRAPSFVSLHREVGLGGEYPPHRAGISRTRGVEYRLRLERGRSGEEEE
jgi:hypothetical protein